VADRESVLNMADLLRRETLWGQTALRGPFCGRIAGPTRLMLRFLVSGRLPEAAHPPGGRRAAQRIAPDVVRAKRRRDLET